MFLLILGIFLWVGAHFYKRLLPEYRSRMGEKGKALMAIGIGLGLILMVIGYRMASFIPIWTPPSFLTHLNNLLMLLAFITFAISHSKGALKSYIRHPMLGAVKIWAFAHLLTNGDLASILLFGSLLAWAVAEMIIINRQESWERPIKGSWSRDGITVAAGSVAFILVAFLHGYLGPSPFPA